MRFLVPVGGVVDPAFGVLTSPAHNGVPSGIVAGMAWGADNGAFTASFDPEGFVTWLDTMRPYRATCLFVAVPDVVGDSGATLQRWHEWQQRLIDWPLAFVCQDGQKPHDIPTDCAAVFIGGTTAWKLGEQARACIAWAVENGRHVHIGRVNWWRRYAHFRAMPGSDSFTCDGTRTRFEGREGTLFAWKRYMGAPVTPSWV